METRSHKKDFKIVYSTLVVLSLFLFFWIETAFGQFTPLTGIPGVSGKPTSIVDYLNRIFILVIVLGALIAVIKIAIAGFKYSMSDIITDKNDAKKDIQGALLGLLFLLGTYVFLYTINPQLTNLNILQNLRFIETSSVSIPSRTGGGPTLSASEVLMSSLTPVQLKETITSCRNPTTGTAGTPRTYITPTGSEVFCCDSGGGSCSSGSTRITNALGIDSSQIYSPTDYDKVLAPLETSGKAKVVKEVSTCPSRKVITLRVEDGNQITRPLVCVLE